MPAGALLITPVPVPVRLTLRLNVGTKVAVTVVSAFMATLQTPVPAHALPLQPANAELAPATAVNCTLLPELKFAVQVAPQLMPAGVLVTVPLPAPAGVTVRANCGGGGGAGSKVAVTLAAALMVTLHAPLP